MEFINLVNEVRMNAKLKKKEMTFEMLAVRTMIQMVAPAMDDLSKKSYDVLMEFMPEFSGTFLDVGCYGGWVYHHVKDRVDYTGIDSWPTGIKVGKTLFGDRFKLASVMDYEEKHDIVWASHLQPEFTITKEVVLKLKSLSRKLLVIIDGGVEAIPNPSARGHNWVAFRK